MDELPKSKICKKCGIDKPLDDYYNSKGGKYGKRSRCKSCQNDAARDWQRNNKDKVSAYCSNWRENNPDKAREATMNWRERNKEHHQEVARAYYLRNKSRILRISRKWYHDNNEDCKRKWRAYYRGNRERMISRHHNRRALMLNADGSYTSEDIKALYAGQNGRCWYCGASLEDGYHIDHFIALSKGGTNDVGNLRLACQSCNLSKGAKHPHEWSDRLL